MQANPLKAFKTTLNKSSKKHETRKYVQGYGFLSFARKFGDK